MTLFRSVTSSVRAFHSASSRSQGHASRRVGPFPKSITAPFDHETAGQPIGNGGCYRSRVRTRCVWPAFLRATDPQGQNRATGSQAAKTERAERGRAERKVARRRKIAAQSVLSYSKGELLDARSHAVDFRTFFGRDINAWTKDLRPMFRDFLDAGLVLRSGEEK